MEEKKEEEKKKKKKVEEKEEAKEEEEKEQAWKEDTFETRRYCGRCVTGRNANALFRPVEIETTSSTSA